MADVSPVYATSRAWLAAASIRFARRVGELISNRTGAGAEIGLGFVPSETAIQLARQLATESPLGASRQPELMALGDIPVARLIERAQLPKGFAQWAALMLLNETDQRWGTLFAWLSDNAQARIPTVGLLTEIAGPIDCPSEEFLAPDAPLRALAILRHTQEDKPLPDRPMQFAPNVVAWLLNDAPAPQPDGSLTGLLLDLPQAPLDVLLPDPDIRTAVVAAIANPRLVLTGVAGRGRSLIAQALLGDVILIDAGRLAAGDNDRTRQLRAALRDACLSNRALVIANADRIALRILIEVLAQTPVPVVLTSENRLPIEWPSLAVPTLDHQRSRNLWRFGLGDDRAETADRMAQQFRLGAVDILRVCEECAGELAVELTKACLSRSANTLDRYAVKVDCRYDWNDLVLPPRQMKALRSIVQRTRYGHRVYGEWGFGEKLAPNRGLAALFSGPSGAGKTLSASVVARDLGLPLYRVDLSATVSKYIGETEKQLEEIFNAAEAGSACLFFDECDALFGKRSEVSDAHDRYANIETSYLLQRLETHRGIVFMASNYPQNIDDAFTRRIDLTVEFPMPDAALRTQLWERLLPPKAGAEIDAVRLGTQFELSGGSIRNCLLTAAFLAAEEGTLIAMQHCLQAVAQEYEKTGRPLTRSDFGESFVKLRPPRREG